MSEQLLLLQLRKLYIYSCLSLLISNNHNIEKYMEFKYKYNYREKLNNLKEFLLNELNNTSYFNKVLPEFNYVLAKSIIKEHIVNSNYDALSNVLITKYNIQFPPNMNYNFDTLGEYECLNCHEIFHDNIGSHVTCYNCGNIYVKWLNYDVLRERNFK